MLTLADIAQHVQPTQVALLFLVMDGIGHEELWKAFLELAGAFMPHHPPEVTPDSMAAINNTLHGRPMHPPLKQLPPAAYPDVMVAQDLYTGGGNIDMLKLAEMMKQADVDGIQITQTGGQGTIGTGNHPIYDAQNLFSVYVHNALDHQFPVSSIFSGRVVPGRLDMQQAYFQHTLVEATLLLMREGMKDPLNHKFVLISDTTIPLYPPQVIYAQLMAEAKSRTDACASPASVAMNYRWRPAMETNHLKPHHWRFSRQWVALSRSHVALALADQHVEEIFHRLCFSEPGHLGAKHAECGSDEHYFSTMLASYGLENQTDCVGGAQFVMWEGVGDPHPKVFGKHDMNETLIKRLRKGVYNSSKCVESAAMAAMDSSRALFSSNRTWPHSTPGSGNATSQVDSNMHAGEGTSQAGVEAIQAASSSRRSSRDVNLAGGSSKLGSNPISDWVLQTGYQPLSYMCPLFARKVARDAEDQTLSVGLSCAGIGLGLGCKLNRDLDHQLGTS